MVTFPAQPSWPLNPFFNKIREMDTTQITKDSIRWFLISADFHAFNAEIQSFFGMIRLIKARIDENIKVVRKDPYPFQYIGPINVDFFSFIIFYRILMDKIARLLNKVTSGGHKPSGVSFEDWRKQIGKYEGPEIEKIKTVIENATWFKDFKDLRDDYAVHHGWIISHLGRIGDEISIDINTYQKKNPIRITYADIEKIHNDVVCFLKELNQVLCDNFNQIPFEMKLICVRAEKRQLEELIKKNTVAHRELKKYVSRRNGTPEAIELYQTLEDLENKMLKLYDKLRLIY